MEQRAHERRWGEGKREGRDKGKVGREGQLACGILGTASFVKYPVCKSYCYVLTVSRENKWMD